MKKELSTAIQAAINAGIEILKIYNTDFDVEIKNDNSPLTIADKNANSVINSFLEPTEIPIISEENKQTDYQKRKNWHQCWIVDPLDGTKEFIKRNGEFTVNIALIESGIPILGVIYVPVTKTLYFGAKHLQKSKKLILKSEAESVENILNSAISIKPKTDSKTIKIVGSRSHLNEDTKNYIDKVTAKTNKNIKIVSVGSSLKFCLVAEGKAEIYPRFAPTMEWDTAAGDAICRMVGLQVIDQKTGKPMAYNKPNLLNNYFLVQT